MRIRWIVFLCLLTLLPAKGRAQQAGQVELFAGAELSYADINYLRLYDVLINVTPGVKWHLGKDWQVAGQVYLPLINDGYPERYDMIRLNMANISKEIHFDEAKQHFKVTAGLFGMERYGADLRWMYPINSWLMVHARLGLVNHWALGFNLQNDATESEFETSQWSKFGVAGASVWLNPWATEFRVSGGRYMNGDNADGSFRFLAGCFIEKQQNGYDWHWHFADFYWKSSEQPFATYEEAEHFSKDFLLHYRFNKTQQKMFNIPEYAAMMMNIYGER